MLLGISPLYVSAEEKNEDSGDLRAATQNPISSMYSLPFKFTFDNGADNGDANILNIQPVLPVSVGDWNLVNRIIIPLADAPGGIPGLPNNPGVGDTTDSGRTSGLGDINYSLFLNPLETKGSLIWGLGGSVTAPTATDDRLGSGKWSAGPTAVGLVQPEWGTYGLLLRHLWSVAGDDDRRDVSQSLAEWFINYNLDNGVYLITDSVVTVDWKIKSGDKVTLPLGGGIGKIFKIGSQPMNMRAEAYYNVIHPDGAPEWTIGGTIQFLFPK
ncbi:MAG: transporter [Gammaproteobacteria bacterium]|nr:transporter [Gammaproteobacteria bacterium]NNJ50558.1 neuromedin U [Gammaproteobacteria bacterium]